MYRGQHAVGSEVPYAHAACLGGGVDVCTTSKRLKSEVLPHRGMNEIDKRGGGVFSHWQVTVAFTLLKFQVDTIFWVSMSARYI